MDNSSADQRHLVAKIGSAAFEIFCEPQNSRRKRILQIGDIDKDVEAFRRKRAEKMKKTHRWAPLWVPFNNYGTIGTTNMNYNELSVIFNNINQGEYGLNYNTSYQSCQEAALLFGATAVSKSDGIQLIRQTTSDTKVFVNIVLACYGILIFPLFYSYIFTQKIDISIDLRNASIWNLFR